MCCPKALTHRFSSSWTPLPIVWGVLMLYRSVQAKLLDAFNRCLSLKWCPDALVHRVSFIALVVRHGRQWLMGKGVRILLHVRRLGRTWTLYLFGYGVHKLLFVAYVLLFVEFVIVHPTSCILF